MPGLDSFCIDQSTLIPARNAWVPRRGLLAAPDPPILSNSPVANPTPAIIPATPETTSEAVVILPPAVILTLVATPTLVDSNSQ